MNEPQGTSRKLFPAPRRYLSAERQYLFRLYGHKEYYGLLYRGREVKPQGFYSMDEESPDNVEHHAT